MARAASAVWGLIMKERPILFSAPMVRALLSGTKTQTRRAGKSVRHPDLGNLYDIGALVLEHEPKHVIDRACPYGQPGDRLWVRETWSDECDPHWVMYRADNQAERRSCGELFDACSADEFGSPKRWRPSIHMPRVASRITLDIVAVGIQRLQDISRADAIAEGVLSLDGSNGPNYWTVDAGDVHLNNPTARGAYSMLWDWINKPGAWDKNPWVWVIEFRVIS